MTFKEIDKGSVVYILDKEKLSVNQSRVTNAAPHINLGNYTQAQGQNMRDVTLDDGKTYTIPEVLSVTYANNIVLSTSQQGLANEVERMKHDAERILDSVDRQKEIIAKSDGLLAELNPQYKERQENEKRFSQIEESVNGMKGMIQTLLDKLS